MSDACYQQLVALALPDIVPLKLEELERHDTALHAAKQNRSLLEYYFTCTAALLTWLFDTRPEIDVLTYLDADLFFFARPDFLLEDFANGSTLIIPHRFSAKNEKHIKWGIYNVGWVSFRRDQDGLLCLGWWRERCLEWCYDIEEADRFADQKYLDAFPRLFARVQIDNHPGVNLAPWNLDNYQLTAGSQDKPLVEGQPVVFFHFHRLRRITSYLWRTAHQEFGAPLDKTVRRLLYKPYLAELAAAERHLRGMAATVPLRRDRFAMGRFADTVRAVAAVIWRGGGIWIAGGRVL
jgi:hypothetical protein